MKVEKTGKGLSRIPFRDQNFIECTLQESHASGKSISFGAENIGLQKFELGKGWRDVDLDTSKAKLYNANTKMHLTQDQVKALLPHLTQFARTGELSIDEPN